MHIHNTTSQPRDNFQSFRAPFHLIIHRESFQSMNQKKKTLILTCFSQLLIGKGVINLYRFLHPLAFLRSPNAFDNIITDEKLFVIENSTSTPSTYKRKIRNVLIMWEKFLNESSGTYITFNIEFEGVFVVTYVKNLISNGQNEFRLSSWEN